MTKIQYLGHSFFRLEFNGKSKRKTSIIIDPFLGEGLKHMQRLEKCPVSLKQLSKAELILLTHEHFDHFEKNTIECLVERDKSLIVAHDFLLNMLDIKKQFKVSIEPTKLFSYKGITVEAFRTHHYDCFYPLGFKLNDGKTSIVHLGDTLLTENFSKIKSDVLLVPIGGTYTLDVVDATRVIKMIKPKIVIPMHYNTFESIKAKASELKEKIDDSNLKAEICILKPKQSIKV